MFCIKSVTDLALEFPTTKGKEGPRKIWSKHVKNDIGECGLSGDDPQDRDTWRAAMWLFLPGAANPIEWDIDNTLISTMVNDERCDYIMSSGRFMGYIINLYSSGSLHWLYPTFLSADLTMGVMRPASVATATQRSTTLCLQVIHHNISTETT